MKHVGKITKGWLTCLLALLVGIVSLPLSPAAESPAGGDLPFEYQIEEDGTVTITSCRTAAEAVTIPAAIDGKPVTTINWLASSDCTKLTSLTIPASVTSISEYAFSGCTGLTAITVAEGNTAYSSEDGVLFNKDKTKLIYCPQGKTGAYAIPDGVTEIGGGAFGGCAGLTSLTIPADVASIGSTFSGCTKLTTITVAEGSTVYASEDGVLFNKEKTELIRCPEGKTGAYAIPDGVTETDTWAFDNCTGLTSLTIPASMVPASPDDGIDAWYFSGCTGLAAITVAEGNTAYASEDGVLFNKDKTTLIRCPEGKTGAYAIPDGVTETDTWAFDNCTGLTSLTIPASMVPASPDDYGGISPRILSRCTKLTAITVAGGNTAYASEDGVLFNKDKTKLICHPSGKKGAYTVPSTVTAIVYSGFADCTGLTALTLPESVTAIGMGVFAGCTGLDRLTIPQKVTVLEPDVFGGCSALKQVAIPEAVTEIGGSAFNGCDSLTDIYFGGTKAQWDAIEKEYAGIPETAAMHYGVWPLPPESTDPTSPTVPTKATNPTGTNNPTTPAGTDKPSEKNETGGGLRLELAGRFDKDTVVEVTEITAGKALETIKAALQKTASKFRAFSVEAIKNGARVQPNGKVTAAFAIPEGFSARVAVYYIADDGKTEKLAAKIDAKARTATVELAHFSVYALVDEASAPAAPPTGEDTLPVRCAAAACGLILLTGLGVLGYEKRRAVRMK